MLTKLVLLHNLLLSNHDEANPVHKPQIELDDSPSRDILPHRLSQQFPPEIEHRGEIYPNYLFQQWILNQLTMLQKKNQKLKC